MPPQDWKGGQFSDESRLSSNIQIFVAALITGIIIGVLLTVFVKGI